MKSKSYEILSEVMPVGSSNARHTPYFTGLLYITPTTLRRMINTARKEGLAIIANDNGYFICDGSSEDLHHARKFIRKLRSHADEERLTAQLIEQAIDGKG